jgi:hypothetical protein
LDVKYLIRIFEPDRDFVTENTKRR